MKKSLYVQQIRHAVYLWQQTQAPDLPIHQCCLYAAYFTHTILTLNNVPCNIVAGSLQWPDVDPAFDNGVDASHFSYMWTPDEPASIAQLRAGKLPELHCWVETHTNDIVDVTTRYLQTQCAALTDMQWSAPPPPDFLWCNTSDLPTGVLYTPHDTATRFVTTLLRGRRLAPTLSTSRKPARSPIAASNLGFKGGTMIHEQEDNYYLHWQWASLVGNDHAARALEIAYATLSKLVHYAQ